MFPMTHWVPRNHRETIRTLLSPTTPTKEAWGPCGSNGNSFQMVSLSGALYFGKCLLFLSYKLYNVCSLHCTVERYTHVIIIAPRSYTFAYYLCKWKEQALHSASGHWGQDCILSKCWSTKIVWDWDLFPSQRCQYNVSWSWPDLHNKHI